MLAAAGVLVLLAVAALIVPGLIGSDDQGHGPSAQSPASSSPTASTSAPTGTPSAPTTPPTTPSATPRLAEATTEATLFLGLLNSNRPKSAGMLACAETKQLLAGQLLLIVEPPTKLAITGPGVSVSSYYPRISVPFSGTTKGGVALAGTVDIMDMPSHNLCVRLITVRP